MTLNQVLKAIYATYLTNYFGFKLKKTSDKKEKKNLRLEYSKTLLSKLNIDVNIINPQKIPQDGQYLLISNHRSVIDPLIVEIAVENSELFGDWIAKRAI